MADKAGPITRAYAPSRHGQLHYRVAPPAGPQTKPPLLCLHQTPSSGQEWEPVLADLAVDRLVLAPDTPGYGMSDPPPSPLSITDFAAIMVAFMDHAAAAGLVAPGAFDVMGAHTGSITATEMARACPERVRRLVLFGLAAYDAETRQAKLTGLRDKFPAPGADLAHVEKLWAIFGQLSDARMNFEDRHVAMAECLRLGSRMPWAYEAVYRYDFLGAMAQVEQPVLVINAQDDLWAVTRQTSELYRHGTRLDLPGVKHGTLWTEKARILSEIEGFLA